MQPSNLCLTCDKETLFDQCPACNPEAFIEDADIKKATRFYQGLIYITINQHKMRIELIKAMIRRCDENIIPFADIIPNLCVALLKALESKDKKDFEDSLKYEDPREEL
jgi:hypothetical protein